MNNAECNEQDVNFICERVLWYLKEMAQDPKALTKYFSEHRLDALYNITDPKFGMIIIGREASQRFFEIAHRFLASQPEKKGKTDVAEFVGKLQKEFSRRFIHGAEDATRSNIDRMISRAHKACVKDHKALRHYIPCALFLGEAVPRFPMGPVTFIHQKEFFATHKNEIEALRRDIAASHQKRSQEAIAKGMPEKDAPTEAQSQGWADHLVKGLVSFFEEFQWIAVVDVPACNAAVSYDRAVFLTRSALNIIKLLLGAQYTYRLRTAEDRGHSRETAKLSRESGGKLDISLSYTPFDNVVGDNWLEVLKQSGRIFDLACRALELCMGFAEAPPLCLRFIESLSWYGDGVAETSPAAKIVKFVTAIEGMTGTGMEKDDAGKDRGVTEIVTHRGAILHMLFTEGKFEDSLPKINKVYDWRSDLVHGSVSPFDGSVAECVPKAEEMARFVLLGGLNYFSHLGLENPAFKTKELAEAYRELEKMHCQPPAPRPLPAT